MDTFPKDCSLCDKTFVSKKDWLIHLLQLKHADKTKVQCHYWGTEVKQSSLVIFAENALARQTVLKYFSPWGRFVVDLVCDASRPICGVIRFDNLSTVEKVLEKIGPQIVIERNKIELKKGLELSALEWKAVLPNISIVMSESDADLSKDTKSGVLEEEDSKKMGMGKKSKKKKVAESKMSAALDEAIRSSTVADKRNQSKEVGKVPVKMVKQASVPNLVRQYAALRSEVEIPKEQFERFLDLVKRMREALKARVLKATVTFFRHQYLKLVNATSNPLLIYVGKTNFRPLNLEIDKILSSIFIKPLPLRSKGEKGVEAGRCYRDELSGLSFVIVTASHFYAEVLTCKWAEYLLKFDPRAMSLLTLINFWARENTVNLAEERIPMRKQFYAIPDPAALEWLCIFFLCQNKIIPTPLEIMNRPTDQRKFEPRAGQLFVPFVPFKSNFIDDWKENKEGVPRVGSRAFVLEVLRMACDFFQFCTSNNFRGSVLKTSDAEIISTRSAFASGLMTKTPLEGGEMKAQKDQAVLTEKWEKKVFLMQPFVRGGRFSICQETFERVVQPLMRKTAEKLDIYLAIQNHLGREVELNSLFRPVDLHIGNERSKLFVDLCLEQEETEVALSADRHQDLGDLQCDCNSTGSICDENEFCCHFSSVLDKMLMPEEKKITMVGKRLNEVFRLLGFEDCQMILFRGRHLNFGNSGAESRVYFFLDHPGLYGERYGRKIMLHVGAKELQQANARIESKGESFKKLRELLLAPMGEGAGTVVIGLDEELLTFNEPNLGLDFCIAPRFFFPEVQTNRLVEYLCSFDRRVKPLMTVILYWAKKNGIRLGKDGPAVVGFAPDPALLEWLVLYFLHSKKILPSPCDLDQGGKELFFDGVDIALASDVGYPLKCRATYQKESRREIALEVYSLAQKFFHYWSSLGERAKARPMVIDLMKSRHFYKDRMDKVENKDNVIALGNATQVRPFHLKLINSEPVVRENFYSLSEAVTFLHPLHVKYEFSFCSKTFVDSVCPKMGLTAENLLKKLEVDLGKGGKRQRRESMQCLMLNLFSNYELMHVVILFSY